jgi:hypothetical protein
MYLDSRLAARLTVKNEQVASGVLDAPHGPSSALQGDSSWVRHHRVVVSQEFGYTDQVDPDPRSVVHILEDHHPVRLSSNAELYGAYPFGFDRISSCLQHLTVLPETGKTLPVPADVASSGGVHNPPWVWRMGIEGRHLRPHDIHSRSLGSRRALPFFLLAR